MSRQPARPADPPALATHPDAIADVGDEFCYELALAMRRILGLNTQAELLDDDTEDDDAGTDPHPTTERS
jgi:hypothetical protein